MHRGPGPYEQKLLDALDSALGLWRKLRQVSQVSGAYASWSRRAAAAAIDVSLYVMVCSAGFLAIVLPLLEGVDTESTQMNLLVLLVVLAVLLGPMTLLSSWLLARDGERNGQTWGKQLLRVRVTRDDGQPWTFKQALWRQLVLKAMLPGGVYLAAVAASTSMTALGLPTFIPVVVHAAAAMSVVVFYCVPLRDAQRRGVHDRIAKSHVMFEPQALKRPLR